MQFIEVTMRRKLERNGARLLGNYLNIHTCLKARLALAFLAINA
jgi:hypothetical protein